MNIISEIVDYENGRLTPHKEITLFAELVRSGLAFSLQGHYGRTAISLIEGGYVTEDGKVTDRGYRWASDRSEAEDLYYGPDPEEDRYAAFERDNCDPGYDNDPGCEPDPDAQLEEYHWRLGALGH